MQIARRRRWAILLPAAGCAGCGSSGSGLVDSPGLRPPSTVGIPSAGRPSGSAYGGYTWVGERMQSVSGSWSVPRILRRSGPGFAGTWIGALAPARTDNGPFIQVGTNEQRRPGTAALKAADGYYAFWSDATARLHTIGLFAVRPGDRVSASLTDGRDGWTVMIVDHTSGARARFFTSEEAGARFNYAIWNEEDVTNGHVDRLFAYPSAMSLVRFSQLAVDGRPPSQSRLKETTLVENGRRLIPTRLIDDSFAMTDATSRLKRVTKHRERG